MQFPISEAMFINSGLAGGKKLNMKLIEAFTQAVNSWYELGKRIKNGAVRITLDMLKEQYKVIYGENPNEEQAAFFEVTADYMNDALKQGMMESGQTIDMPVSEVYIYSCYEEHPPKPEKMEGKARYFKQSGHFQSEIILDKDGYLIDGYTSYLLAAQHKAKRVLIRYGKRQIIKAYHREGGKLYEWELPQSMINRVSAGDRVLVPTKHGIRVVTVAAVEPYKPQEHIRNLRTAIKVRKGGAA